jgi:hypothetical protein
MIPQNGTQACTMSISEESVASIPTVASQGTSRNIPKRPETSRNVPQQRKVPERPRTPKKSRNLRNIRGTSQNARGTHAWVVGSHHARESSCASGPDFHRAYMFMWNVKADFDSSDWLLMCVVGKWQPRGKIGPDVPR